MILSLLVVLFVSEAFTASGFVVPLATTRANKLPVQPLEADVTRPPGLGDRSVAEFDFFPYPAAQVWEILRDWQGSYITDSAAPLKVIRADENPEVGCNRYLVSPVDGEAMTIKEELSGYDDEEMWFTYRFLSSSPFPADKYGGLCKVEKMTDSSSRAIWVGWLNLTNGATLDDIGLDVMYQAFFTTVREQLDKQQ